MSTITIGAITFGATGLSFGAQDEASCAIISVRRTATAGSREVSGAQGDIIGHGAFGFKAEYSLSYTSLGMGAGLPAAGVGTLYSLSNAFNTNGVSGGSFIVKSSDAELNHEDFQRGTAAITQYPSIG